MPGWIGLPELIILLVVVLVVFGPKRLPEMGRSLGRGMREIKHSVSGLELHKEPTALPPSEAFAPEYHSVPTVNEAAQHAPAPPPAN